jgi:hypothetical protein
LDTQSFGLKAVAHGITSFLYIIGL